MAIRKYSNKVLSIVGGVFILLLVVSAVWAATYISNQMATRDSVAPNAPTSKPAASGGVKCTNQMAIRCIGTACCGPAAGCDVGEKCVRNGVSGGILGNEVGVSVPKCAKRSMCVISQSTTKDGKCLVTGSPCESGKQYVDATCLNNPGIAFRCGSKDNNGGSNPPPVPVPTSGGVCPSSHASCGAPERRTNGVCVHTCWISGTSGPVCWEETSGCATQQQSACGTNYDTSVFLDCGTQCCTKATQICTNTGCKPK